MRKEILDKLKEGYDPIRSLMSDISLKMDDLNKLLSDLDQEREKMENPKGDNDDKYISFHEFVNDLSYNLKNIDKSIEAIQTCLDRIEKLK